MRVAVIGATGPVGAAVVEALRFDPHKRVSAVVGIARRLPPNPHPDVEWHAVDPTSGDLAPHLRGIDALVNAARARRTGGARRSGPSDDVALARRVLDVAAATDVHHVVQLSSFLAYAPAGDPEVVADETWPTDGLTGSPASRAASNLEHALDVFKAEHEVVRLVRIRPGAVLGPLVRQQALARSVPLGALFRVLAHAPFVPGLRHGGVPVVHHDDLASAVRSSVTEPAFGAYNVALDARLGPNDVARALGARTLMLPEGLVRHGAALSDRLFDRISRGAGGRAADGLDLVTTAPGLDTRRAREGLGWSPRYSIEEALRSTLGPA